MIAENNGNIHRGDGGMPMELMRLRVQSCKSYEHKFYVHRLVL
jgi:hypothetical protein